MRIVLLEGGERRISTREFAQQWPMRHKDVLAKVREILEIFPDYLGPKFRPQIFQYEAGKGAVREDTEYLMDWEGFWTLATSCQGPKAMRARRELVESVKRALGDRDALAEENERLATQLAGVETQLRLLAKFAEQQASEAGRALNAWKAARVYRDREALGQGALPLVLEYPDVPVALAEGGES